MFRQRSIEAPSTPSPTPTSVLHWNANEPFIEAIAKRARSVLSQRPGDCPDQTAGELGLPAKKLRAFVTNREHVIDAVFLVDLVSALVYDSGVDPKWLLTGQYDGALHREAL